jgi:hypothetical protein
MDILKPQSPTPTINRRARRGFAATPIGYWPREKKGTVPLGRGRKFEYWRSNGRSAGAGVDLYGPSDCAPASAATAVAPRRPRASAPDQNPSTTRRSASISAAPSLDALFFIELTNPLVARRQPFSTLRCMASSPKRLAGRLVCMRRHRSVSCRTARCCSMRSG